MNDVLKVLFADDSNDFCEIINEYFSTFKDFKIVSIAKNGFEAYEMIMNTEPDIVVLDMIMPYIDGIGVLEKLKVNSPKKTPLIIILSAVGQENITQRALSLGAHYYFVKPFSLDLLAERIRLLGNKLKDKTSMNTTIVLPNNYDNSFPKKDGQLNSNSNENFNYVTRLIRELGIPAHIKGYQFLRDAIIMADSDMEKLSSITKLIYPDIAKQHNTTATRVESAIRHAIEVAWENADPNTFKRIFGYDIVASMRRPSNSEFIATIIDTLKLEMK